MNLSPSALLVGQICNNFRPSCALLKGNMTLSIQEFLSMLLSIKIVGTTLANSASTLGLKITTVKSNCLSCCLKLNDLLDISQFLWALRVNYSIVYGIICTIIKINALCLYIKNKQDCDICDRNIGLISEISRQTRKIGPMHSHICHYIGPMYSQSCQRWANFAGLSGCWPI